MVLFLCVVLLLVAGVAIAKLAERASQKHSEDPIMDNPDTKPVDAKCAESEPSNGVRYSKDHDKKTKSKSPASSVELIPLFRATESRQHVWVCQYCDAENKMECTKCAVCAKPNAGSKKE